MLSSPFCTLVLRIKKETPKYKHCLNFVSFELFFELKLCLLFIYKHGKREKKQFFVSKSYFTNKAVQNINKAFVYHSGIAHAWNQLHVVFECLIPL